MRQPIVVIGTVFAAIAAGVVFFYALAAMTVWDERGIRDGWLFWGAILLVGSALLLAFAVGMVMMVGGALWGAAWAEDTRGATRVILVGLALAVASVAIVVLGWAIVSL